MSADKLHVKAANILPLIRSKQDPVDRGHGASVSVLQSMMYVICVMMCCTGLLEKLKGLTAVLERKLGESVTVPVYSSHVASLKTGKDTFKERGLHAGMPTSCHWQSNHSKSTS